MYFTVAGSSTINLKEKPQSENGKKKVKDSCPTLENSFASPCLLMGVP